MALRFTGAGDIESCYDVLIVDDQPLVRRGLALMLSLEADMEVLGEAGDGIEAVEQAKRLRPDVVLMDLHMPRKGGVAATREITASLPQKDLAAHLNLSAETLCRLSRRRAKAAVYCP
ncbi:MAG: response regulator transcription factor [Betaproteobacteria bacterium]|nr:MAG: response regulator transcription factor [Betaproteobacteria bacterium]